MSFNEEEYPNQVAQAEELISTLEQAEQEEEEETQYTEEVWGKAMQRIEEANLFKLLIKDAIFQPGSASPNILNAVNKKIRAFAIKELESLLGILNQQEKEKEAIKAQFDNEEAMALKVLASTMLKRNKPAVQEPVEKTPKLNQIAVKDPYNVEKTSSKPVLKKSEEPNKAIGKSENFTQKPVQKVRKPQIGKAPKKGEFAKPSNSKPLPMPKSNQLAANLMPGAMVVSGDAGTVNQGSQALLSQIMGQLVKEPIHVDTGTIDTDSSNERF